MILSVSNVMYIVSIMSIDRKVTFISCSCAGLPKSSHTINGELSPSSDIVHQGGLNEVTSAAPEPVDFVRLFFCPVS